LTRASSQRCGIEQLQGHLRHLCSLFRLRVSRCSWPPESCHYAVLGLLKSMLNNSGLTQNNMGLKKLKNQLITSYNILKNGGRPTSSTKPPLKSVYLPSHQPPHRTLGSKASKASRARAISARSSAKGGRELGRPGSPNGSQEAFFFG